MATNKIKKAAFIGSGLIGTGISINCITSGIEVTVQTRRQIDLCKSRITEGLDFLVGKNNHTAEKRKELRA